MRTHGRDANGKWVVVETDPNGYNDEVWLTTLAQCLRLAPEESPYYSKYGIPGVQSVIQQILPTFYVSRMQRYFQQYFSSLQIAVTSIDPPIYTIAVTTNSGAQKIFEVAR